MFESIGRVGKIYVVGFLFGALFLIFSELFFGLVNKAFFIFFEVRFGIFPAEPLLMFFTIFLNNLMVILFASIGAIGLTYLLIWGRKNFSWWNKINESRFGDLIDRFVWWFTSFFKPELGKIDKRVNRDIFIVVYGIPTIVMIVNGWFLGFLFAKEGLINHISGVWNLLKWIAPHGVLEIPVLLASASIGLDIADRILKKLYNGDFQEIKKTAKNEVRKKTTVRKLIVLISLLLIAAYIEAYITPLVAVGI